MKTGIPANDMNDDNSTPMTRAAAWVLLGLTLSSAAVMLLAMFGAYALFALLLP